MTNDSLRVMAEVLIAAADGKSIEFRERGKELWYSLYPLSTAIWNFHDYEYRIKPDPIRECLNSLRKQLTSAGFSTKFLDTLEELMVSGGEQK